MRSNPLRLVLGIIVFVAALALAWWLVGVLFSVAWFIVKLVVALVVALVILGVFGLLVRRSDR